MKVQVCRQCGKQNVVISGPLTQCIFCDSSDLGDIENYSSEEPSNESNIGLKAGISVAVVLSLSVGGYLLWQSLGQGSAQPELTTASKAASNMNIATNEARHSTQQKMDDAETSTLNDSTPVSGNSSVNALENENQPILSANTAAEKAGEIKDQAQTQVIAQETNSTVLDSKSASSNVEVETVGSQVAVTSAQEANVNSNQLAKEVEMSADKEAVTLALVETKQSPQLKASEVADKLSSAENIDSVVSPQKPKNTDQVKAKAVTQKSEFTVVASKRTDANSKVEKAKVEKTVSKRSTEKLSKPVQVAVKNQPAAKSDAQKAIDAEPLELKPKQEVKTVAQVKKVSPQQVNQRRNKMRILDFNKGLVTDNKTGLMWMSCSLGMDGIGNGCYGEGKKLSWSEALKVARQSNFGGFSDWRLPTRSELNSIVNCSNGRAGFKVGSQENYLEENGVTLDGHCLTGHQQPSIDRQAFSNTKNGVYWSSSQSRVYSFSAWVVLFDKGSLTRMNKNFTGYVRLVRSI